MEYSDEYFLEDKQLQTLLKEETCLLIDYLERTYHASLWAELPELIRKLEDILNDPAYCYPHLQEVLVHLKLVAVTLFKQMLSEEVLLFVTIRRREKKRKKNSVEEREFFKILIGFIESEHALVKEGCSKISCLCENFQLPIEDEVLPDLYASLKRCETLILKQIYLESNLLFKKII